MKHTLTNLDPEKGSQTATALMSKLLVTDRLEGGCWPNVGILSFRPEPDSQQTAPDLPWEMISSGLAIMTDTSGRIPLQRPSRA